MELEASLPEERDGNPIPISALQHAIYCMRQAALIHIERMWEEKSLHRGGPRSPRCCS